VKFSKKTLERFKNDYKEHQPGICDNLSGVIYNLNSGRDPELFKQCMQYVHKYKPDNSHLYWWPTGNRGIRMAVLELAIADALAAND
jgi:hypothetical protein